MKISTIRGEHYIQKDRIYKGLDVFEFLIKSQVTQTGIRGYFQIGSTVFTPKELIGKRIMLKVEVLPEKSISEEMKTIEIPDTKVLQDEIDRKKELDEEHDTINKKLDFEEKKEESDMDETP